jgi:hypothetical protein
VPPLVTVPAVPPVPIVIGYEVPGVTVMAAFNAKPPPPPPPPPFLVPELAPAPPPPPAPYALTVIEVTPAGGINDPDVVKFVV